MQLSRTGRFVYFAQWWAAVVLPFFMFVGRVFVGAEAGVLSYFGTIVTLVFLIPLLVPPILTRFDREVRAARTTRVAYDIATFVLWAALIIGGLTIPDGTIARVQPRGALTTWTSGAVSTETSIEIFRVCLFVIALSYLATLTLAVIGVVRSRRAPTSFAAV